MSLTAALRPVGLPFGTGPRSGHEPADDPGARPFHHEVNYLNLHRMLLRYQNLILLTPSPSTSQNSDLSPLQRQVQAELWSPLPYYRTKWLHNIEGARTRLLQLERKAQGIRVQRAKYEAIKDLAEKRSTIKALRKRVEEIGREVEMSPADKWQSPYRDEGDETIFDYLQKHGKSTKTADEDDLLEGKPVAAVEAQPESKSGRDELFGNSTLRRRGKGQDTESPAQTSGFSNLPSTERSLLDSSRVHEDITASLVSMAAQLKQEQRKLQFSLQQDSGILGRAMEGLDVSLSGMEAASKKMKFLQRMSEEEGWLGRMKLYAMIFAMWVAAFLLVFVCPKLRFG
jgi:hypothetical protein